MLVLAFDTATDVATSALLDDGRVLGERDADGKALLGGGRAAARAGAAPADLGALVVGTGPGSFTSTRIGLSVARGLALALDLPVAGVSTLDALASARADALPVIDARRARGLRPGPARRRAGRARVRAGNNLRSATAPSAIGTRSRARAPSCRPTTTRFTSRTPVCTPRSRVSFGPAEDVEPIYVRAPDARAAPRDVEPAAPRARRPRHGRGDRARVVPDAVVALDVRRGAAEAERARARRVPRRAASSSGTRSSRATSTRGT